VKLHLLLDHDGYLPSFAVITEGKKHEVRVARQMQFAPGAILVFDRGYTDYEWFANLTKPQTNAQSPHNVSRTVTPCNIPRAFRLFIRPRNRLIVVVLSLRDGTKLLSWFNSCNALTLKLSVGSLRATDWHAPL